MIIRLTRKIGFFYKDEEWAEKKFIELRNQYHSDLERVIHSRSERRLVFHNGSTILFAPANDSCRGCKFDEIYYQKGISEDILNVIVRPCLVQSLVWEIE
jgi:hypothetical protein